MHLTMWRKLRKTRPHRVRVDLHTIAVGFEYDAFKGHCTAPVA